MWKRDSKADTSWQKVSSWYDELVSDKGHYYHQQVILPNMLRLMKLKDSDKLLDLACGQGVLARAIPKMVNYVGVDISGALIEEAIKKDENKNHKYVVADVMNDFKTEMKFNWITVVLAMQNVKSPYRLIANAKKLLDKNGRLLIVLNHPCFRIPKMSDWGFDEIKRLQYRKIEGYMRPKVVGITAHPGKTDSVETVSYHYPLSAYVENMADNGLGIEVMEEWVSNKKSEGGRAREEDVAREEFPLFMCLVARAWE
jgi:ubiquinone/menaquinone biosynthesis C-methylase UbiE